MRSMHEKRNFALVLGLILSILWAALVWMVLGTEDLAVPWVQRVMSLLLVVGTAGWLLYAFGFEAKLPDRMRDVVGEIYYGADGMDLMPVIHARGDRAELSVYYQNRHENPAQVIVHLRPPDDGFIVRPGMRDMHFAFMVGGGDFGVIHQPIAVPEHLQGELIDVQFAAATYYPRSHGARVRKERALPCGTLHVDWGGSAFRTGVHEVSGEIELIRPTLVHFSLPTGVESFVSGNASWRQERLTAGGGED